MRTGSTGRPSAADDPLEQGGGDEAPHQRGALVAREGRPHEHEQRLAGLRRAPDAEQQPDEPLAELVRVAGERRRQQVRGVHRELHGRDEDALLGAEVVVHERRVHLGRGAMPRTVVPS